MIRRMFASLVRMLRVRLELAGLELQDEIDHVVRALAMAVGGALLLCAGVVFGAIAVIVALWETHRVLAIGGFAALFAGAGAVLLWLLVRASRDRPPMFAETLAQFEQDRLRLGEEQPARVAPPGERVA